ncbi:hypothetical protein RABR111495_01845 [Rahnella bruchi]|uniref:hypothetical protein n=1 Tax=Rahnella bruchi TaxID=1510573 RepID=UPI000EA1215E|nr:hypothetical protein [Rahnella bruchi]
MNSDYASVTDQSGIFAGNGGFDISVGNHTQLNGGVIASDATSDKNRLDTGTLGWNDIRNKADYSVESSSASMSSSGNNTSLFMPTACSPGWTTTAAPPAPQVPL